MKLRKVSLTAPVKEAAGRGLVPCVHIEDDNIMSQTLFRRLGFRQGVKASWVNTDDPDKILGPPFLSYK